MGTGENYFTQAQNAANTPTYPRKSPYSSQSETLNWKKSGLQLMTKRKIITIHEESWIAWRGYEGCNPG